MGRNKKNFKQFLASCNSEEDFSNVSKNLIKDKYIHYYAQKKNILENFQLPDTGLASDLILQIPGE